MKYLILSLLISGVSLAKCPEMQKKYYVNGVVFKTHSDARKYIDSLKSRETDFKKLDVTKKTPYKYLTRWIKTDHGSFCVCRHCRTKTMANHKICK